MLKMSSIKLGNIIPEYINNQIVPKDILSLIDVYIPKLNDKNIRQVVKDYLSEDVNLNFKTKSQYGNISNWDVSNDVTDMSKLFSSYENFNEDISNWDVSNVTHMNGLFCGARTFNQDISGWNVSNVTDMQGMFVVPWHLIKIFLVGMYPM